MKKISKLKTLLVFATAATSLAGMAVTAHAGDTSSTAGTWSGYKNTLDISPSIKDDTLYGYNNGCMYAKFSHTALVSEGSYLSNSVWDGHIIESTNSGTASGANSVYTTHWQSHFHNYDAASLDYFYKSGTTFNSSNIVYTASNYKGTYSVTSSYTDNSQWYCSKLVSRAVYDNNGYHLGFYVWGSFITPYDVWADSAVYQRTHATSSHYDGAGAYVVSGMTAASTKVSGGKQYSSAEPTAKTFTYHGAIVHADQLSVETMKAVDARIAAEKAAGKPATKMEITIPIAKAGVKEHLKQMIKNNKATKAQVEASYGVTDAFFN